MGQTLSRMNDADLNNASVKFSGKYLDNHFPKAQDVERNLVLNTTAHGFYMGARRFEEIANKGWKFWIKSVDTDGQLTDEAIKASCYYIKKKGYQRLSFGDQALIRATTSFGFRNGFIFMKMSKMGTNLEQEQLLQAASIVEAEGN